MAYFGIFRLFDKFLGAAQGNDKKTLTEQQILAIVDAFTQGDRKALDVTKSALEGALPADFESLYVDYVDGTSGFGAIAVGLESCRNLEMLDWAEGLEESAEAFGRLFAREGINPSKALERIQNSEEPERGDSVALAYAAFRSVADAANMRILGINDGSDQYHFTLVPSQAAEKWVNVHLGDGQYIEDSDWQFKKLLKAEGFELRSTKHPSSNVRQPPSE